MSKCGCGYSSGKGNSGKGGSADGSGSGIGKYGKGGNSQGYGKDGRFSAFLYPSDIANPEYAGIAHYAPFLPFKARGSGIEPLDVFYRQEQPRYNSPMKRPSALRTELEELEDRRRKQMR